ncbi:MAG: hypothetical protein ABSG36_04260 [Acidimicrobiales bacterium]
MQASPSAFGLLDETARDEARHATGFIGQCEHLRVSQVIAITAPGVLGITSPALTMGRGAPQAVRLVRSGAAGVSVGTWIQALVLAELWSAYGFLAHVQAEVVTNIPGGVLAIVIVVLVGRRTSTTLRVLTLTTVLGAVASTLIVLSVVSRAQWIVSVPAVVGAVGLYLPQLIKLIRYTEVAGVSLMSWVIAFFATGSWTAYGIVIHKLPVVLPNVVMIPSALGIVVRVCLLRRRSETVRVAALPVDGSA